jgi:uncharacterized RDD family membrane protein YckC
MTEQQFSHYEAASSSAEPAEDIWRNEVHSRLARYKRRRGRRIEGAYTMRFPFPADEVTEAAKLVETATALAEPAEVEPEETVEELEAPRVKAPVDSIAIGPSEVDGAAQDEEVTHDAVNLVLEAGETLKPEPEPFVDTVVRPRPKRKVIAFPKHLSVAPEQVYRLADPVTTEVPRILDVPEELQAIPTTPFLDGLQFESPNPAAETPDREHVELPFRAARPSQRVLAGMVDLAVVGVSVAVFAAVGYETLANPPLNKLLILALVAAAVVLWGAYEYLFVVHTGKTLGMMAARLRIRTLKGKPTTLRQRRNRVLGLYLSALSLGMGLLWTFVDVDTLCWHDRLSRTYLSERQ